MSRFDTMYMAESVLNSKIPDLLEVLEKAKADYGRWMDAKALRMHKEIITLAERIRVLCRQMFRDGSFNAEREEEEFDEMWDQLLELFHRHTDHCHTLQIFPSDIGVLVFTSDEEKSDTSFSESEEEMVVEQ